MDNETKPKLEDINEDISYLDDLVNPYMQAEKDKMACEGGYTPNRFFSKDESGLQAVGDMVLIRISKQQDITLACGLIVPLNLSKNHRLITGEIISIGPAIGAGLEKGMIVEFDQHATFNYGDAGCDTADEIVAIRSDNIILFKKWKTQAL